MTPVLALSGVSFAYAPGQWALRHIDLDVKTGTCIALMGANGAGKSSLLLMLSGGEPPCAGSLLLDGLPVHQTRDELRRLRRGVGILLQEPDDQLLAPTVEHDVALGPLQAGASSDEARRLAREALDAMEITHLACRPVHELSLGEKKRAALAGLVAMRPRVLLLDEPAAGLDPRGVKTLLAILERLREDGTAVVQATHDVNLAYEWADRAYVLSRGSIIAGGDARVVLSDGPMLASAGLDLPLLLREREPMRRRAEWAESPANR
ncbi:MAG: energy-coupling factor ABC transporter ATP-binding protein [Bryobacteraceae bacterium]